MKPLNPASLVLTALLASGIISAHAQSTAFTYQGRLRDNNVPAAGTYDLRFGLFDNAGSSANQIGQYKYQSNVALSNGLFCVTLDFGTDAFTGGDRWLEISIANTGVYTPLSPRRALTPTPYAVYARNADTLDGLHGSFYQNAANLTGVAPKAVDFTGTLAGDVTGTQASTVVAAVGGVTAVNVASGANAANGATSLASANALVKRDPNGDFAAGAITATTFTGSFVGSGSGLTSLNGDQITSGTVQDVRLSHNVPLLNANQVFRGSNVFNGASLFSGRAQMTNTTNVIVGTHGGDGASLSNLTAANLTGVAPKAVDFTGTLAGDVTGTQASTVVAMVGGVSAANVALGASAANLGTATATANAIVKRDGAAGFAAGAITATTFTGSGSGLTALNADQLTSGTVLDARLSANAISVIDAANNATSDNIPNTIVKRDANGAFAAGTITGTFSGDGSGLVNIPASSIVGGSGGGGTGSLPPGIMVVSMLANDPSLLVGGYRVMMTVPALAWVSSSAQGSPSGRFGHTATWSGDRLIIWGGRLVTGSSYLNSGGIYYPDGDQWQAVSTIDAPSPRWGHTAVWSGSEMLVWGGNGASGRLNTGGRYQPDRRLWKAISTTGAPSARTEHVAVCAGTQMLIWGGQSAAALLNDGALYNPVTDQWTGIPQNNAPDARVRASAVLANDRVLIWGGEAETGVLNSGSQLLNPGATAQWVAITSVNAPAGRIGHSAIWTGSKMIIWGGQTDGVPFGDGAAYDPATDSWDPLPTSGAPSARFDHSAVWTGEEMLIFAGSNSTIEFASGAAYNPATRVWRPLSSSGGPLARTEATAAWTGTEVLIFGGRAQGVAVGSLQRLVPQPVWYFYRKL